MPKVSFSSNAKDIRARLKQVRAAIQPSGLRRIEAQVVPEALGMLILGLNATVYETQRGAYVRTGELLRGAHVDRGGPGPVASLLIYNTEEYAPYVEYGIQPATAPFLARARAGQLGDSPQPLVTGRSGVMWQKPSLAHTRAQVWSALKLKAEIRAALLKVWG